MTGYYAALRELCGLRAVGGDLRAGLARVGELAVLGVDRVDSVSSGLGPPDGPILLTSSSALAQGADGLQHLTGCGPLFDAFALGTEILTADLYTDPRWLRLGSIGEPDRIVSWTFTLPLRLDQETAGVMTFYAARESAAAGARPETAEQVLPFATAAEALVRDAREARRTDEENHQLKQGLTSRAVIDQAKGMIMMGRRCDADEAFVVLQRLSSTSGRKVREVAEDIVAQRMVSGPRPARRPRRG